jgi:hypothetical protein
MARITGTRPSANTERVGPRELIETLEGSTVRSARVVFPSRGSGCVELTLESGRTVRIAEDLSRDAGDSPNGFHFAVEHEPYVIDRAQFEALAQPGPGDPVGRLWRDVEAHFRGRR